MARTVRTKVYKFDELSEEAKEKAIQSFADTNVNYEWWESIYDDASNVLLRIEGFDIDRGNNCDIVFREDAIHTAFAIKDWHGEETDTYKLADTFLQERDEIVNTAAKDEHGNFDDEYELDQKLDEIESDFLKDLSEEYLSILRNEYEYQTSEEAIIETIKANEYEFTKDGKQFNS